MASFCCHSHALTSQFTVLTSVAQPTFINISCFISVLLGQKLQYGKNCTLSSSSVRPTLPRLKAVATTHRFVAYINFSVRSFSLSLAKTRFPLMIFCVERSGDEIYAVLRNCFFSAIACLICFSVGSLLFGYKTFHLLLFHFCLQFGLLLPLISRVCSHCGILSFMRFSEKHGYLSPLLSKNTALMWGQVFGDVVR